MYQPAVLASKEEVESKNVDDLAATQASYSVCHAHRLDSRDNGKKVAAGHGEFVKTEIFIDHPPDGAAAKLLQRKDDEE